MYQVLWHVCVHHLLEQYECMHSGNLNLLVVPLTCIDSGANSTNSLSTLTKDGPVCTDINCCSLTTESCDRSLLKWSIASLSFIVDPHNSHT